MRIRPAKRLRGRVSVPGDKSISHRAAIIAALARGRTRIENFSTSADCDSTLEVLRALGVGVERGQHHGKARVIGRSLPCALTSVTLSLSEPGRDRR